jgi:hypothetical protein
VTIAWYVVATAGLALTGAAMRDRWHRYTRAPGRLAFSPRSRYSRRGPRPARSSPRTGRR